MSWPSRSKRSVVRTMSSCNGVPTIWAINPIKTAGCANRRSCNAGLAKLIVLFVKSMGCANERSCNATQARRLLESWKGSGSGAGWPVPTRRFGRLILRVVTC